MDLSRNLVGAPKYFSLVVLKTTLGNFLNMQIKVAITKQKIYFFNVTVNIRSNVLKVTSKSRFLRLKIK